MTEHKDQNGHPDSLTPGVGPDAAAIEHKFHVKGGPALLDVLDDPSQLLAAARDKGHELSVAEVILCEMLSTMRRRVHHGYGSDILVPISQAAAGYTKIIKPPSANQYVKLVTFCVTSISGAARWRLVQGDSESASDPNLTGDIFDQSGSGPVFFHAPNPDENPILFTSPGLTMGLVTTSAAHSGFAVVRISDGPQ